MVCIHHHIHTITFPGWLPATDVLDKTGVQNLTSLPRTRWAKLYKELVKNPVNRRSLNLIGSSIGLYVLESVSVAVRRYGVCTMDREIHV